jgi:hypothetical protein
MTERSEVVEPTIPPGAEAGARPPREPRRLRLLITALAGSGGLLLAIAAVGLAGVGPLAS